jgi:hypothetical protein
MPLSPPERIRLIKEISIRLGVESYPLIDVTLKQFSLPWTNEWGGTKEEYVLSMVENAADQSLIDLAEHVGFQSETAPPPGIDPPFWRKGMFRLFISHLSAEKVFAGELQNALLDYGISGFVAHNDIEPTSVWQSQIETALATCDALIATLHNGFHLSNWTDQEIGFAMGRGVPVFAIRLGQDPYGFIGRFQAFNGNGKDTKNLARELFDSYRKGKQTQEKMGEVLVELFEQSGSFAEAKVRIAYLEELETWKPSFPTRILSAAQGNSQISAAWGVQQRVDNLIKKWAI